MEIKKQQKKISHVEEQGKNHKGFLIEYNIRQKKVEQHL